MVSICLSGDYNLLFHFGIVFAIYLSNIKGIKRWENFIIQINYIKVEAELSKEGKMTYKRVGVIQPKENLIWDNRYMASEEQAYGSDFGFTTFRKVSGGDFYPGMLIREIK